MHYVLSSTAVSDGDVVVGGSVVGDVVAVVVAVATAVVVIAVVGVGE